MRVAIHVNSGTDWAHETPPLAITRDFGVPKFVRRVIHPRPGFVKAEKSIADLREGRGVKKVTAHGRIPLTILFV
jgi:hypothetical protein